MIDHISKWQRSCDIAGIKLIDRMVITGFISGLVSVIVC